MNNKRQTIWLVSMLSLMVVLSAYYLFTEDTGTATDPVADSTQVMDGGTAATPGTGGSDELTINEVVTEGGDAASGQEASGQTASGNTTSNDSESNDTASNDTASNDTASGTEQAATEGEASKGTEGQTAATGTEGSSKSAGQQTEVAKTDEQVLEEVKAGQQAGPEAKETAAAVIDGYLLEREVNNQKKQEELMAAINDKSSTEAVAAQKELTALEDKQAKITGLEEELEQQFASAVVKEEDNDVYKVVVLSDKMDAKQAVSIVDKVMKELNVTQDKIKVQYVSE
ncbi:SpoIIIAH-like family protein [Paenibacillus medicaginis]|uniref:SpoIIIAH-like family protein n=1 Tax=Paenibacillus medicaginis TaxID=1470560 RepID=A0ABV5BWK9_9BACL